MRHIILLNLIIVLFLLYNCKDAEVKPKDYPYVITNSPIVNEEGVELSADIISLGNHQILEYGFVWNIKDKPTIDNNSKSYDNKAKKGTFSFKLKSGLSKGQTYFFRAYILTKEFEVYSNTVSIVSLGSLPPLITSFEPDSGHDGSIVKIIGKNFSPGIFDNKIIINDNESEIIEASENEIIIKTPKTPYVGKSNIIITSDSGTDTSKNLFNILGPVINKITPSSNKIGGNITISGKYFTFDGYRPSVYFGNIQASLNDYNEASINAIVPPDINNKEIITVNVGHKKAVYPKSFSKIESWKKLQDFPGGEVCGASTFVLNKKAYVVSGEFADIGTNNTIWVYDLNSQTWSRKNDFPGKTGLDGIACTIDNIGYYGFCSEDNESILWQYDETTDTWSEKTRSPQGKPYDKFFSDSKIYLILESYESVWEYNPELDQWKKVSTVPDKISRQILISVPIGNNIYIGDLNEFYMFNTVSYTWNRLADIPENPWIFGGFILSGKIYYLSTSQYGGDQDLYEYNIDKNVWTRNQKFIGRGRNRYFHFSYNDKAYIGAGRYSNTCCDGFNDFWELDLNTQ